MRDYAAIFAEAHPKAIDFRETEFKANQTAIEGAASGAGYRLAGTRLGFAVFTTKPEKANRARPANDLQQKRS